MVLDTLRGWLASYSSGVMAAPQHEVTGQLQSSLKQLEKRLADLDARTNRAFELVETGVYSPALYAERKSALDTERASVLHQMQNINDEIHRLANEETIRLAFVPKLRHVLESYESAENAQEQNRLLKTVIDKIVYTKTVRVTSNNPGNLNLQIHPRLPHQSNCTL